MVKELVSNSRIDLQSLDDLETPSSSDIHVKPKFSE